MKDTLQAFADCQSREETSEISTVWGWEASKKHQLLSPDSYLSKCHTYTHTHAKINNETN